MYRYVATVLCLMLFVASGVVTGSATAQSLWEQGSEEDQHDARFQDDPSQIDDPAGSGVPDWADSGSFERSDDQKHGGVQMNAPGPPDNPSRIPVDGGLTLLALAGAGYAARKLRNRGEDDETDGMP